jgi:hypothetical protein
VDAMIMSANRIRGAQQSIYGNYPLFAMTVDTAERQCVTAR